MKQRLDHQAIVCSLTSVELRDREAKLLSEFRSAIVEAEELEQGYAFHLQGDDKSIRLVVGLDGGRARMLPLFDI